MGQTPFYFGPHFSDGNTKSRISTPQLILLLFAAMLRPNIIVFVFAPLLLACSASQPPTEVASDSKDDASKTVGKDNATKTVATSSATASSPSAAALAPASVLSEEDILVQLVAGIDRLADRLVSVAESHKGDCARQKAMLKAETEGDDASMAPEFRKLSALARGLDWDGKLETIEPMLKRLEEKFRDTGLRQRFGKQLQETGKRLERASCESNRDASTIAFIHIILRSLSADSSLVDYGIRRYLLSVKTAEAKEKLGAISRAAYAAYEREPHRSERREPHVLCKSARPVPHGLPPKGTKYQPLRVDGKDYLTGDRTNGWKCLGFEIDQPHFYQYHYNEGGNYIGPQHGGPDPGPDGYEAAAVGDLDGDGVLSVFTLTGKVDKTTNTLTAATQLFIHNEFE